MVCLYFLFRYNKLAERRDDKLHTVKGNSVEGNSLLEDMVCIALVLLWFYWLQTSTISFPKIYILFVQSAELHIYTDFLRLVLEIINAILTYALPRNPEVFDL